MTGTVASDSSTPTPPLPHHPNRPILERNGWIGITTKCWKDQFITGSHPIPNQKISLHISNLAERNAQLCIYIRETLILHWAEIFYLLLNCSNHLTIFFFLLLPPYNDGIVKNLSKHKEMWFTLSGWASVCACFMKCSMQLKRLW